MIWNNTCLTNSSQIVDLWPAPLRFQMSCWQKRRSTRASARNSTRLSPSWPASKLLKSLLLHIIKVFNTHDTSTMLHRLERHFIPSWTLASGSIINLVSIISSRLALNVKIKVILLFHSSLFFLLWVKSIGIDCQCMIWLKCNWIKWLVSMNEQKRLCHSVGLVC